MNRPTSIQNTRWVLTGLSGLLIFLVAQPTLANLAGYPEELQKYLVSNTPEVGSSTINGYQQVYYILDGAKHFITHGNVNHHNPTANGRYVVYQQMENGTDQLVEFDLLAGTRLELTYGGTNQGASVDKDGRIAWEKWTVDRWQIWIFDGSGISPLTNGDVAVRPKIREGNVVFARQDNVGNWRSEYYDARSSKTLVYSTGPSAAFPNFKNNLPSVDIVPSG